MIKMSLIVLSALALLGCNPVDDAVNNALSGDTTTETISAKQKVLIINNVSRTACVLIKNGLLDDDDFKDAEILVTQLGVNCASYGKTAGVVGEVGTECVEQSLAQWLEEDDHDSIISIENAQGDNTCVIGFNS